MKATSFALLLLSQVQLICTSFLYLSTRTQTGTGFEVMAGLSAGAALGLLLLGLRQLRGSGRCRTAAFTPVPFVPANV